MGKGITFDTGGLNLKPAEGMYTMKCDMAGAAAVLAATWAIAQLGLRIDVTAYGRWPRTCRPRPHTGPRTC